MQLDDVQAYFLGLQQNVLAQGVGLCVEGGVFQPVHPVAGSVEAGEVEALRDDEFSHGDVLVIAVPQVRVRQRGVGQVVRSLVLQLLRACLLGVGLQLPVVHFYLLQDVVDSLLRVHPGRQQQGGDE